MNNIDQELHKYKNTLNGKLIEITGNNKHLEKIINYTKYLIIKNQDLNLISRQLSIKEIIFSHIIDSLVGYKYFKDFNSITDLGSGGGLPAIVLAIIYPEKKITLIEKSPKKVQFLKELKNIINFNNVSIVNAIIEDKFINSEAITCRAFKDINTILLLTKDFLKKEGTYILYKGRLDKIKEELSIAKKKFKIDSNICRINEIEDKERHMVIIKKQ